MASRAEKESHLDELIASDPLLPAKRYHDALRARYGRGIPMTVIYERLRTCVAERTRTTIKRSTAYVTARKAHKLEVLGQLVRDHPGRPGDWYRGRLLEICGGALSRNELYVEISRLRHGLIGTTQQTTGHLR